MSVFSQQIASKIGIDISAGESFNLLSHSSLSSVGQNPLKMLDSTSFKSNLPPAVANVPAEHIRGYVHQKKVNFYLVGNTLGEGSFAKVKEAFHISVGEKVAMKVIDKKKAQQDTYVAKNFKREAKLLQMVRHPNILQLLEVIETDSSYYLITELCSGGELMKHIYDKGRLEENETRKFMRQLVSAVDHLHRSGIIHRDLKVENMLLDSNMDLKLIDFGLSNEEYVQGENGLTHCSTQCGSPAYAAPELLGHKRYGPPVDIWSIGVNMYAMLTGCLPYTVEPFNITALHAKMLENKMNPIPDTLTASCKDLLKQLLKSNPDMRIKMPEIMKHSWMNEGHALPFGPAPYPNKLQLSDINKDILQHMVYILKVKENEEELMQELISNKSTQSCAIYHLMTARLARYNKQFQSRSTNVRHKPTRISRDYGYYEGSDEDDAGSVMSMPTKTRRPSRQSNRFQHAGKDRPISYPSTLDEEKEEENEIDHDEVARYLRNRKRRNSMPEKMLKSDIEKFLREKKFKEPIARIPVKRPITRHNITSQHRRESPPESPQETPPESTILAPIHPMRRNQYSVPNALNQLRHDLNSKLGHQNVKQAWHSNPTSRNASRNPSRSGSRQPSGTMRQAPSIGAIHNRTVSFDIDDLSSTDKDDLIFHPVESNTLPRSNKRFTLGSPAASITDTSSHLPSITEKNPSSSWNKRRYYSDSFQERKNGYTTRSIDIKTELNTNEVLTEILRAAHSLKMREVEQVSGSKILCTWSGIKFQLSISTNKDYSNCKLMFHWISGGDLTSYKEKCDRLLKKIKL